jgi:hypothetical protein
MMEMSGTQVEATLVPISCVASDACREHVREEIKGSPIDPDVLATAKELYWLHRHVPVRRIADMLGVDRSKVAAAVRPGPETICGICGSPALAETREQLFLGKAHCETCKDQRIKSWRKLKVELPRKSVEQIDADNAAFFAELERQHKAWCVENYPHVLAFRNVLRELVDAEDVEMLEDVFAGYLFYRHRYYDAPRHGTAHDIHRLEDMMHYFGHSGQRLPDEQRAFNAGVKRRIVDLIKVLRDRFDPSVEVDHA